MVTTLSNRAILGVVFLLVFSGSETAFAQKASHSAIRPCPQRGSNWYSIYLTKNASLLESKIDLLMIGDAHAWDFPHHCKGQWKKYYAHRNAYALCIMKDRTQNILWILDNSNIAKISPKLVIVSVGTNNAFDNTGNEIAEGILCIVKKLREKLPQSKILVLAILPHGLNKTNPQRETCDQANQIVETEIRKSADPNVTSLNVNSAFLLPNGVLRKELMRKDYHHLNAEGYRVLAEAIEPTVKRLMGD